MLSSDLRTQGFNVAWDLALSSDGRALYAASGGHGLFRMGRPSPSPATSRGAQPSISSSDGCSVSGTAGGLWPALFALWLVAAAGRRR